MLMGWCERIKEAVGKVTEVSESDPANPASELEVTLKNGEDEVSLGQNTAGQDDLEQPAESVLVQAADPFAFDMSAFDAAPPQQHSQAGVCSADPLAFDMSAFGEVPQPKTQQPAVVPSDPFAFDMSAFGEAPALNPSISVVADPFAFDASAFESSTQPADSIKDPYAFSMDAFSQGPDSASEGTGSQAVQAQSKDPFAFDMSAFRADQPGGKTAAESGKAAEQSLQNNPFAFSMSAFEPAALVPDSFPDAHLKAQQPAAIRTNMDQPPHPCSLQPGTPPRTIAERRPVATGSSKSAGKQGNVLQTSSVYSKPSKEAFQPLSVAEVSELRHLLLESNEPPNDDDKDAEEMGKEDEGDALPSRRLALVTAEDALKIAEIVASGLPDSIIDATALDYAGQRAAANIQVPLTLGFGFIYHAFIGFFFSAG